MNKIQPVTVKIFDFYEIRDALIEEFPEVRYLKNDFDFVFYDTFDTPATAPFVIILQEALKNGKLMLLVCQCTFIWIMLCIIFVTSLGVVALIL